MNDKNADIDLLAASLEDAKERELEARKLRIEAEQALIRATGIKREGSTTIHLPLYKITTTGNVNRTMKQHEMPEFRRNIGNAFFIKPLKPKYQLVVSEFNAKLTIHIPSENTLVSSLANQQAY